MEILAVIPARAGSKRIAKKNIALLNNKPLIAYTIEAARKSKYICRIVVSTDSSEIAQVAQKYGAQTPFLRPRSISKDDSTEMEFLEHALDWFSQKENYVPDLIVLLYPTSPFRTAKSIDKAIEIISQNPQADSLRSIRLCSEHPYKMWTIQKEYLKPFVEDKDSNVHTFSYHLLPSVYIQNASIYITKVSTIKNKKSTVGDLVIPFVMDEEESLDINSPLDFKMAEIIAEGRSNG